MICELIETSPIPTTAFLVVADEAYGRQIPFAFLERWELLNLQKLVTLSQQPG